MRLAVDGWPRRDLRALTGQPGPAAENLTGLLHHLTASRIEAPWFSGMAASGSRFNFAMRRITVAASAAGSANAAGNWADFSVRIDMGLLVPEGTRYTRSDEQQRIPDRIDRG